MDTNVKSVAESVWWLVLLRGILMVVFGGGLTWASAVIEW